MMRSPIDSISASALSRVRSIPPAALVFGTVSRSTTVIQGVAGIDVKYLAAAVISSSVIARANPAIKSVLNFL